MWTSQDNKIVMECYLLSEPKIRGYRKRMLTLWLQTGALGFPDISPTDISPTNTSPTDFSPTRDIPDGHFPDQTHPRRIFPQPDTSPMDTSPTRHIPDRHLPDQTYPRQTFPRPNGRQIFSWVDASHNGHFPDQLNTSNNLKYLKKYIVRDNFGNIHAVVRTLEI